MSAIDAPVFGFPPYASGKTTVFMPSGVAVAKKQRKSTSLPIDKPKIELTSVFTQKSLDFSRNSNDCERVRF